MIDLTRRSFVKAAAAIGATSAITGTAAFAEEAPAPGHGTYEDWEPLGLDCPWGGPGSEAGDWQGTPEDIKALGGSTMPLDELNRRRKMCIDSREEYVCEDGTVIPVAYVRARALIHVYGFGVGNSYTDHCFDWVMDELAEEQAQALTEMPMGKRFTPYEFAAESGRTLEECEQLCEDITEVGWLCRTYTDRGVLYNHNAEVLGLDEYHTPQCFTGVTDLTKFIYFDTADTLPVAFGMAGAPFFSSVPVTPEVVKDGEIYPFDDIAAVFATKEKLCISPCCCRTLGTFGMREYPGYPDGDYDLEGVMDPINGQCIETCLTCGDEAAFWIEHHVGREITKEEALTYLQRSVDEGFIIQRMADKEAETVGSCHGLSCGIVAHWRSLGDDDAVAASRTFQNISHYELEVDFDKCIKCGTCANRCPVQSITMDGPDGTPQVSPYCFRCGQCAYVCPMEARKLVPKPEGTFLPLFEDIIDNNNRLAAERFESGLIWQSRIRRLRISLFFGIRVTIDFSERNPPHFHASYAGRSATIDIENSCILKGSLPKQAAASRHRLVPHPPGRAHAELGART